MQSGMRPRQRTFTSCTECRRRKQRCNQAKDRPCNNCARRYPPVVCTYESSSPPPTIDHIVNFRDNESRYDVPSSGSGSGSGSGTTYTHPSSQSSMSYTPTTTTTDGYYNPTSSYEYYSAPPASSTHYHAYSGESSGAGYTAYSSSGGYAPVSGGGYYQNVTTGYTPVTTGGYYSSAEQDGAWLSTGDPGTFADAGGDYYYPAESDQGHQGHPASGP